MITDMVQLNIVGPRDSYDKLLDVAWQLDCLHLIDIDDIDLTSISIPSHIESSFQYSLERLEEFDTFFNLYKSHLSTPVELPKQLLDEAASLQLEHLGEFISSWKKEKADLDEKIEIHRQNEGILRYFQDIVPDIADGSLLHTRGIIIRDPNPRLYDALRTELERCTEGLYQLNLYTISSDLVLGALLYPHQFTDQIRVLLEGIQISELSFPSSIAAGTITEKIQTLMREIDDLDTDKSDLFLRLQLAYQQYLQLNHYHRTIKITVEKYEGLRKFRQSRNFTFIGAYAAKEKIETIKQAFAGLGPGVFVYEEAPDRRAPTQLSNTKGVREFQIFTDLLPPLAPGSIDPTIMITIFFPLFYGFIVGDIAYGLIIAGIGYWVYHSQEDDSALHQLGWVYFLSGLSSVLFGFAFGEFLGDLAPSLGIHPLLFHRGHDLMTLLLISIGIGIVHVLLGIALGAYNSWIIGQQHGFYGHLGMLITLLSVIVLLVSVLGLISIPPIIPGLSLIPGIYFLIRGEGFIGVIEIISTIANMLSYARLMALGAASVILADLANEMYTIAGGGILGIIVAILIHVLNIIIAMFSPTIHAMRLHLVEFFSKFVEFGGATFTPFGPTALQN